MNRETLKFVEGAKDFFNKSKKHFTYRDKDDEYIALRYGLDGDCIKVYQLGKELELFEQWCDKSNFISVDNKYKILDNTTSDYQENKIYINEYNEVIVQMNGIDDAIKERDLSMSVDEARDFIDGLNACIHHAKKVRKEYLSR